MNDINPIENLWNHYRRAVTTWHWCTGVCWRRCLTYSAVWAWLIHFPASTPGYLAYSSVWTHSTYRHMNTLDLNTHGHTRPIDTWTHSTYRHMDTLNLQTHGHTTLADTWTHYTYRHMDTSTYRHSHRGCWACQVLEYICAHAFSRDLWWGLCPLTLVPVSGTGPSLDS